ncbi:unnamed protein product, partial [Rotaria sp. Silwood2]
MGGATSTNSQSGEFEQITTDILNEFEKSRQKFPELFPKPLYVLEAVDHNRDGEWEQRLREAKEHHTGERLTIIPYNVEDSHWVGVILKFDVDGRIHEAEYIDPVVQSDLNSDELQNEFSKVFPEVPLQSRSFQQHDGEHEDASLLIKSLIQAIQEDGNQLVFRERCRILESRLKECFEELEFSSVNELEFGITQIKQDILRFKAEGKEKLVQKREITLLELEKLQSLVDEIKALKPAIVSDYSYEKLESQLKDSLEELELQNTEELGKRIMRIKQDILQFKAEAKENLVQKRETTLLKLETVQSLADQMKALEPVGEDLSERIEQIKEHNIQNRAKRKANVVQKLEKLQSLVDEMKPFENACKSHENYKKLESQLQECLEELEFCSVNELEFGITQIKQDILRFKAEGKEKLVQKREITLLELEKLQSLVDKMKALEPAIVSDYSYENLESQLKDSLEEHELQNIEELGKQIMKIKQDILTDNSS